MLPSNDILCSKGSKTVDCSHMLCSFDLNSIFKFRHEGLPFPNIVVKGQ